MLLAADVDASLLERGAGHAAFVQVGLGNHLAALPAGLDDPALAGKELFVKRGGAFYSPAVRCRSAQRNFSAANSIDYYTGVRVVMEVAEP